MGPPLYLEAESRWPQRGSLLERLQHRLTVGRPRLSMSKPFNRLFAVRDLGFTPSAAAVVRFVSSTRRVIAIQRAIGALGPTKTEGSRESIHHLVVLLFGATKEAADAFRDCDSQGFLSWTSTVSETSDAHLRDTAAAVVLTRQLVDKRDPGSLYSRYLKPVRDSVGMHTNRDDIQQAMAEIPDEEFWACTLDASGAVESIPLARRLLRRVAWTDSHSELELSSTQLSELITALANLAIDLYFVLVADAVDPPVERAP